MKESESILSQLQKLPQTITTPRFASKEVNILDFHAQPNSKTPQTKYIQCAIDTLSAQGGGFVIVPSGRFLTGALHLKSGVNLHLESPDSTLCFTTEMTEAHYPLVFSHWEASPCYNYSALIYAIDAHDIGLTGLGTLDGQADFSTWWSWHHQVENSWSKEKPDLQNPARLRLRQMNHEGIPIKDRIFGNGHYLRPNFVQIINCQNILIENVTFKRSPMWQLNPVKCKNIIIRGVTLSAHGPNSDGCDPESCQNVLIEHNFFDTGDDCISLKSGRDRDGRNAAPCQNIIIRNNHFLNGHGGIALGSEMSGGIQNIYADNNLFESPDLTYILRFKTNAKRGGFIRHIWLHNTKATAVHAASVHATMLYEDGRDGDYLPSFSDICIDGLTACGGEYGIFLEAFPEVPITGLVLRDIHIRQVQTPLKAFNWKDPVLDNVVINGLSYPRPADVCAEGIPMPGAVLQGSCVCAGEEDSSPSYSWFLDGALISEEASVILPENCRDSLLSLRAADARGQTCESIAYRITDRKDLPAPARRLISLGMLQPDIRYQPAAAITRGELAHILYPLCFRCRNVPDAGDSVIYSTVLKHNLMPGSDADFRPEEPVLRQVMATIAMESCGNSYKNASTTMPRCADAESISAVYGTNIARALYFGFMACDSRGYFHPLREVTWEEAVNILNNVALFARL